MQQTRFHWATYYFVCFAQSLSCVQLFATPWTVRQSLLCPWARILECIAFPSPGIFPPRNWTWVSYISCLGRWILYHCNPWEALCFILNLTKEYTVPNFLFYQSPLVSSIITCVSFHDIFPSYLKFAYSVGDLSFNKTSGRCRQWNGCRGMTPGKDFGIQEPLPRCTFRSPFGYQHENWSLFTGKKSK